MKKPIVLAVCDHFEPEIRAALSQTGCTDVEIRMFPGRCGHPPMNWEEFQEMASALPDPGELHVMGGCCLVHLDTPPAGFPICRIHKVSQCFYMVAPRDLVDACLRAGAYLVTPGWLVNWKRAIAELGFDSETARSFFQESMKKVVLLNTGTGHLAEENLREFAAYVGLPSETVEIGTEHLRSVLSEIILGARLSHMTQVAKKAQQQKSDFAMVLDLIQQLGDHYTEKEVMEHLTRLLVMLFAPETVYFQMFRDGRLSGSCPENMAVPPEFERLNRSLRDQGRTVVWSRQSNSMLLKVTYHEETVAMIFIGGIQFPQYRDHYMALAQFIRGEVGLFISHARQFEKLKASLEHVKRLSGLIPICSNCKKIRDDQGYWQDVADYIREHSEAEFSHGICPDCIQRLYPDYCGKATENGGHKESSKDDPKK